MTLTQLKYLIAVVDNRLNISLAAENLNTSQPGISKQLKLLEEELLATIFVRKGKKLTDITPFGDEVIFYARKILQDVSNIGLLGQQLSSVDEGVLTIATTHSQARYVLPDVIKTFKLEYPKVKLELKLGSANQIHEMVQTSEVDIAIATDLLELQRELVLLPAYHWYHAIIAPLDHPIKKDFKRLTINRLAKEPLVTYAFSVESDTSFSETFENVGLKPNIVFSAKDADIIKTYVNMGMGVGVIAGMAYNCDDHEVFAITSGENIFPRCTAWFGFRRGMLLRNYLVNFINLFAPSLSPKLILKAAEASSQSDLDKLMKDIDLPSKGGCDEINTN
jgi:LysR family cys regulon transcriptional activator